MARYGMPPEMRQIEYELRDRYGGCLTLADVGRELGIKRHRSISDWLSELTPLEINGRKKWRAADVARKIYESRV